MQANPLTARTAPTSIDAEEAVLCCILLDGKRAMARAVASGLYSDCFFKPMHKDLFRAMMHRYGKGMPIDSIMIADDMMGTEWKETIYSDLSSISNRVETTAMIKSWCDAVMESYRLRKGIDICTDIIDDCYARERTSDDILSTAEKKLYALSADKADDYTINAEQLVDRTLAYIQEMANPESTRKGLPCGFIDIDRIMGAFRPAELIILAARPSVGKTALAGGIVCNYIHSGLRVLFFSLEMKGEQIGVRVLSLMSGVPIKKMMNGTMSKEESQQVVESGQIVRKSKTILNEYGETKMARIRGLARKIADDEGVDLIVVDYLQQVRPVKPSVSPVDNISHTSMELKAMAKELDKPVLALAQINRDTEKTRTRDGKTRKPALSDLKGSGQIEQEADVVIFLHRETEEEKGEREIIVAKNRNGACGRCKLTFKPTLTRFENYQEPQMEF